MADLNEVLEKYPGAVTFTYGDGPDLNQHILELVRKGAKTMTCDAWDAFAVRDEPLPQKGRVDIALDWSGQPAVAVRTHSVERMRFCDVTENHVPPQAEFRDLDDWRKGYKAYLQRSGLYTPQVEMLLERFELVEDFAQ